MIVPGLVQGTAKSWTIGFNGVGGGAERGLAGTGKAGWQLDLVCEGSYAVYLLRSFYFILCL